MKDFALGWKVILFVAELIIFLVVAFKSAALQGQEEKEFLAGSEKKA
jgi:hypothetical protein